MKPRVGAVHVGEKYKEAVEECFMMRARFLRRENPRLTAGDLDRCIKGIVEP